MGYDGRASRAKIIFRTNKKKSYRLKVLSSKNNNSYLLPDLYKYI